MSADVVKHSQIADLQKALGRKAESVVCQTESSVLAQGRLTLQLAHALDFGQMTGPGLTATIALCQTRHTVVPLFCLLAPVFQQHCFWLQAAATGQSLQAWLGVAHADLQMGRRGCHSICSILSAAAANHAASESAA